MLRWCLKWSCWESTNRNWYRIAERERSSFPSSQTMENITTQPSSDSTPELWNPNAAACWSLMFSPAFGAFLHARNAERLGRKGEAKANWVWFYASLIYICFVLVSIFIPAIPDSAFRGIAIGILLGWYFSLGKTQIQYVKNTFQNNYRRKSWSKPLLIAFGSLLGVVCILFGLALVADSLFPE